MMFFAAVHESGFATAVSSLRGTMRARAVPVLFTGFENAHSQRRPESPEWRPYIFARDEWHCRICGDRFQYSESVRKHIAHAHDENIPPSMYEYFRGAVWQRKKIP
jgi:hypothetical protein